MKIKCYDSFIVPLVFFFLKGFTVDVTEEDILPNFYKLGNKNDRIFIKLAS